ncbi:MAG: TetR/AcrR family transcriptional regulator [Longimicrobiales bacterium]
MTTTTPKTRRRTRSDGDRTHAAILDEATRLASIEGVHGLTIGRLAEALGVSKSGLYAHFGSKEQLQRETVEAAVAIFEREVMSHVVAAPEGLRRLEAFAEAYFSYLERWVFPGGCFFASLLAEVDARSGPMHDYYVAFERLWMEGFVELARGARRLGEIGRGVDVEQLAFELYACFELANYHFVLFRDERVLERGRKAVRGILGRAASTRRTP